MRRQQQGSHNCTIYVNCTYGKCRVSTFGDDQNHTNVKIPPLTCFLLLLGILHLSHPSLMVYGDSLLETTVLYFWVLCVLCAASALKIRQLAIGFVYFDTIS